MSKITDAMLELIPFQPVPSPEELELIAAYSPKNKEDRMKPGSIGVGASREVYPLVESPENYVLKVQRKNSDKRFGNQSKTEIQAFLSYPTIRKWMPQIFSFDTKDYRWIVSERCEIDRRRVNDNLRTFSNKTANEIIIRLKELGIQREKLPAFTIVFRAQNPYDVREALRSSVNNTRIFPLRKKALINFKESNYHGASLVDSLWEELLTSKPPTLGEYVPPLESSKRISQQRKIKRGKRIKLAQQKDNPWTALLDILHYCHPLICDFAIETLNTDVHFRDLHAGNIGISKVQKQPFDLKVIDLGIIRRQATTSGNRKTPSELILHSPTPLFIERQEFSDGPTYISEATLKAKPNQKT